MTSTATTYAVIVTISLTVGYWAGTRWAVKSASSGRQSKSNGQGRSSNGGKTLTVDSDSDSEAPPGEDLASVKPSLVEDCKFALVVRTDLGMSSGKIAAQCSHATLACYKSLNKSNPAVGFRFFHSTAYVLAHMLPFKLLRRWERTGQGKVTLRAKSEEELDTLEAMARSLNLCARSIHDAGRTQIAAGSRTVLGIGPGPSRLVNQVTGRLRLL